jgi:hypothetical protein
MTKKRNMKKERRDDNSNYISSVLKTHDPSANFGRKLDMERCDMLFRMSHCVPAIQTCISLINRYLFADGIQITHDNKTVNNEKGFNEHLNTCFKTLGEDAVRWIYAVGVVPVTFVESGGDVVPVVVKHGLGDIYCYNVNNVVYYRYSSRGTNAEGYDRVVVYSGFGYGESSRHPYRVIRLSFRRRDDAFVSLALERFRNR